MWSSLILAIAASLLVIYLPGYLFARGVYVSRLPAFIIAPVFSCLLLALLGILFHKMQFSCAPLVLFAVVVLFAFLIWCLGRFCLGKTSGRTIQEVLVVDHYFPIARTAGLYIAVATIIVLFVFILGIDGPNSFARNDDTAVHLALIRGYLDTGYYSSLDASSFLNVGVHGGFYPAAWHVLVAIVASMLAGNIMVAMNGMIVSFLAVVFPLIVLLFLSKLFAGNRIVIVSGALFTGGLCGFPWGFVVYGQLLPNMISFMFVPVALLLVMELTEAGQWQERLRLLCLLFMCLLSMVFAHTNGLFTFGIWAVLYGMTRFFYSPGQTGATVSGKRIMGSLLLFSAACVLWVIAFNLPFLQSVLRNDWGERSTFLEAVLSGLGFMLSGRQGLQPFISVIVLVGIIQTLRNKRYLWLSVAYLAALFMYIMDMSIDIEIKQFLTGFWYTDPYRTGSMAALFAIPLAAFGFAHLYESLQGLLRKKMTKFSPGKVSRLAAGTVIALFVISCVLPAHIDLGEKRDIHFSGLVAVHKQINEYYSWDKFYTSEEHGFVEEVMDCIPKDVLVLNIPSDGSGWAYGVDGINLYFRRSVNNGAGSNSESELIRTKLCDITESKDVQDVVEKWNAHYLLVLDDAAGGHPTVNDHRYKKEDWVGMESITSSTPGFNLVLSEDDMRLYEIDYNSW